MEKHRKSLKLKKKKKDESDSSSDSEDESPAPKKLKMTPATSMGNSRIATAAYKTVVKATPKSSSKTTPKSSPKGTPKSSSSQSRTSSSEYPPVIATPKNPPSTTTSSSTTPPKSKLLSSKKMKEKEKRKKKDETESSDSDSEEDERVPVMKTGIVNSTTTSSSTDVSLKARRQRRKSLKQTCGTSQAHAGSVLMYRCIESAINDGTDYRKKTLNNSKWAAISKEVTLTHNDLSLIWLLIDREYGDMSLEDIMVELKPAATMSASNWSRKETMERLKAEKPKAPLTAYMLYCKIIRPKFKEKYPDLTHGQLAVKIGKKWKSLSASKQMKYRQEYQKSYEEYKVKMERFLAKHPEARSSRMKSMDISSMEAKKLMKLKELKPKCPPSAMALYIKDKTASVQKKHPNLSPRQVKEKLTRQWKSLSLLDMAPYRKRNIEMNAKYEEDLVKFFTDNPGAEQLLARKRRSPKKSAPEEISGGGRKLSRNSHSQEDSSSSSESTSSEEEEEEEVISGSLPLRQDRPSRSTINTPSNLPASKASKQLSSTPSLTKSPKLEGPSTSSTPYPPKQPNDSSVHIPIIDSDNLSSSDSEDSSEY